MTSFHIRQIEREWGEEWNYQFVIAAVRTCVMQMFIVAFCKLCESNRLRHDSRRGRNTSEMLGEIITLCHDVLRRGDNTQHRFFTWTMNFDRRLLQEEGKYIKRRVWSPTQFGSSIVGQTMWAQASLDLAFFYYSSTRSNETLWRSVRCFSYLLFLKTVFV